MKFIYKILIALFIILTAACNIGKGKFYSENSHAVTSRMELGKKLDSLLRVGTAVKAAWKFYNGNNSDSLVNLPHSILLPDSELHYEAILNIKQGYVKISGDDNVRLWINGERKYSTGDNFFRIQRDLDRANVKITVLNNAMSGGLKKITYYSDETFTKISDSKQAIIKLRGGFPKFKAKKLKTIRDTLSFAFWGDSQGGWDTFPQIVQSIESKGVDFSIGLGDLVGNGSNEEEWINFNNNIKQLSAPVFLIAGNHEYDGYADNLQSTHFMNYYFGNTKKKPYYNFNVGKCSFITLDPNINFPLGIDMSQYEWMIGILKSEDWKNADWRFLIVHQPPLGQGWAGYHGEDYLADMLDTLAEMHKIDFVLSGHIHDYERLSKKYGQQKTNFIISGGAGGELEPIESSDFPVMDKILKQHHFCQFKINRESVQLNVFNTSGKIIDYKKYAK